ncbi:MAG: SpoIIE family protein phosphatase [Clostridiales Family XIII bacterium]|jgi:sigma-B regulation protein RsbU (phosphoserine phosphatase)|nr:SpoIIE family protein phosphatase [Clostridiales Family XIII bacterium]
MSVGYEEMLSRVAEHLIDPMMLTDADQVIVYQNEIMRDTFGDLTGKPLAFLLGTEAEKIESWIRTPGRSGSWLCTETILADVTYRLHAMRLDADQERQFSAILLRDITEQKVVEDGLATNLQKIRRETAIAKQIQKSILPIDDEYWNSMRLSSLYLPADDLGGDVFDIIQLSEDETLLYIADVAGHGIQASLLTVFIREKIRAEGKLALGGLEKLIAELLNGFLALDIDAILYFSILFCKYNRAKSELSIANAGHNCYPLVIREGGRVEEVPVRGMPISKISDLADYEEEIIGIKSGDRLILYTDGVIEEYSSTEKRMFGAEGVRQTAGAYYKFGGQQLAQKIISEANKYTLGGAKDDRAIIIAEIL